MDDSPMDKSLVLPLTQPVNYFVINSSRRDKLKGGGKQLFREHGQKYYEIFFFGGGVVEDLGSVFFV